MEKVLEIGAGWGYAAAVLSQVAGEVYTVETIGQLASAARNNLARQAYSSAHVLHGDGTLGWPEHAPFDGIVVAAGSPRVQQALKEQLAVGSRLVSPVGSDARAQELLRVTRVEADRYETEELADVRFVPLIGAHGWTSDEQRRRQRCMQRGAVRKEETTRSSQICVSAASLLRHRGDRRDAAVASHRRCTRGVDR
jgi:protein-L-isoaspartate(D-aspartate) O-methyltransferase